jgi:surface protein
MFRICGKWRGGSIFNTVLQLPFVRHCLGRDDNHTIGRLVQSVFIIFDCVFFVSCGFTDDSSNRRRFVVNNNTMPDDTLPPRLTASRFHSILVTHGKVVQSMKRYRGEQPFPIGPQSTSNHRKLQNSIMTDDNIRYATFLWVTNTTAALATYGNISTWDASRVTSTVSLFRSYNTFTGVRNRGWASSFNDDLSHWNTSQVSDMSYTFSDASAFNGDLSQWVTSMRYMFVFASSFNGNLSNWNTRPGVEMNEMFYGASSFNGDASQWDTNQVTLCFIMRHPSP